MDKSQMVPTKQSNTNGRTGRKSRAPGDGSLSPGSSAEPEPGEGAELLRNAVDKLVGKECGRIAKALVDKTIAGDVTSAKLVTELAGAKGPRTKPPRKRQGITLAQWLGAQPQWKGPPVDDELAGYPDFETAASINPH